MNFAPDRPRKTRDVRWNPGLECFELRCHDCRGKSQVWWPMELEFWDPQTLQRCRACEAARNRRARRAYYAANPELEKARNRAYDRKYRRKHITQAA